MKTKTKDVILNVGVIALAVVAEHLATKFIMKGAEALKNYGRKKLGIND